MQKTAETLDLSKYSMFGKITFQVEYCWCVDCEEDVLNRVKPYPNRRWTYSV